MPSLINAADLDISPPEWLVEGVLPRVGFGFLRGPSYTGKSLVANNELALAVANGTPFFGHDTVQGCVAVALGEGLYDAGVRLQGRLARQVKDNAALLAAAVEAGEDPPEFPAYTDDRLYVYTQPFQIPLQPGDKPAPSYTQALAQLKVLKHFGLELVVIDAMPDFTGSMSLSNDSSANRYILGLKMLVRELDCAILVVAHNTADNRKMIGAARLFNAADFVIEVVPDTPMPGEPPAATLYCRKTKYGREFLPMPYQVEAVEWDQEVRDENDLPTGEMQVVSAATVRLRTDGEGSLRAPSEPRPEGLRLPDVRDVVVERKRSGVRKAAKPAVDPAVILTTGILSVPCVCGAAPMTGCDLDVEGTMTSLGAVGKAPVVHESRITAAVASGAVDAAMLIGQYDGTAPENITGKGSTA